MGILMRISCLLSVVNMLLTFTNILAFAEPSVLVETVPIKSATFTKTLTAYGNTQPDPAYVMSINLPRSGIVGRVWVRTGQLVERGALLFELDTSPSAGAQFQHARAALDYARSKLRREEELFRSQLTTRDQVANAKKSLADAESQLEEQRKLGTGQAGESVKAPFPGVITKLSVNQGDLIQAGAGAMSIARRDSLIVSLGAEPEEATQVRTGMAVTLTPVFQPGGAFKSQVSEIHAMVNPATKLIDVVAPLKLPANAEFPLGLRMKGVITLSQSESLGVPRSAVISDPQGSWIFIAQNGKAHKAPVKKGISQNGLVAISGPIKAGDEVVVVGNYELSDGIAIRKRSK